jgi:hypothetical protein
MRTSKILTLSALAVSAAAALSFVARSASAGTGPTLVAAPSDRELAAACAAILPAGAPLPAPGLPAAGGFLASVLAGAEPDFRDQDGVRGVELALFRLREDTLVVVRPYDVLDDQIESLRWPTLPSAGHIDHQVGTSTKRYELRLVSPGTLVAAIPAAHLAGAGHRFEAHVWGDDANGPVEFLSGQVDLLLP